MWWPRLMLRWRASCYGLVWPRINTDLCLKWLCQLEGSDCGGRDRRPSWHWRALSILNWMASFDRLTFGHQPHPQRSELYTRQGFSQRLFVTNPTKTPQTKHLLTLTLSSG